MDNMPNKNEFLINDQEIGRTDGSSALQPEIKRGQKDNNVLDLDKYREESQRETAQQIGEVREEIKNEVIEDVLPVTSTAGVEAKRAPRGVFDPASNQGRDTTNGGGNGGDNTVEKSRRWLKPVAIGSSILTAFGIGYGIFADKVNAFFGGGNPNPDLPPTNPIVTPGTMPSQEATPGITVLPSPEQTTVLTPEPTQSLISEPTETAENQLDPELEAKKQDFIKRTGDYTDEKIKDKLFSVGVGNKVYELGVISYNREIGTFDVQGWLFNYKEDNGNLVLEVGKSRPSFLAFSRSFSLSFLARPSAV